MVSIIILSFNTQAILQNTIDIVLKTVKSVEFELIVLDNASSDLSVQMIKENFPRVKLIESKTNLGFGNGINKAVESASGEYLLFLNSDLQLKTDSIADMIAYYEGSSSHIGAIGGRLISDDDTTSDSFGYFPDVKGVFGYLFFSKKSQLNYTTPTKVDWVSGGYMLISKSNFLQVNGFDPNFFMYVEDMEFCYRLARIGLNCIYFPQAKANHLGQASSNRGFAVYNILTGIAYFFKKHKSKRQYLMVKLMIFVKAIVAYIIGVLTNKAYLRDTYGKILTEIK